MAWYSGESSPERVSAMMSGLGRYEPQRPSPAYQLLARCESVDVPHEARIVSSGEYAAIHGCDRHPAISVYKRLADLVVLQLSPPCRSTQTATVILPREAGQPVTGELSPHREEVGNEHKSRCGAYLRTPREISRSQIRTTRRLNGMALAVGSNQFPEFLVTLSKSVLDSNAVFESRITLHDVG